MALVLYRLRVKTFRRNDGAISIPTLSFIWNHGKLSITLPTIFETSEHWLSLFVNDYYEKDWFLHVTLSAEAVDRQCRIWPGIDYEKKNTIELQLFFLQFVVTLIGQEELLEIYKQHKCNGMRHSIYRLYCYSKVYLGKKSPKDQISILTGSCWLNHWPGLFAGLSGVTSLIF